MCSLYLHTSEHGYVSETYSLQRCDARLTDCDITCIKSWGIVAALTDTTTIEHVSLQDSDLGRERERETRQTES